MQRYLARNAADPPLAADPTLAASSAHPVDQPRGARP